MSKTTDKHGQLLRSFHDHVSAYDAEDPKIRLKIDHSLRVAELAEQIAETVRGADPDLAWTAGLLHDIGRFEQIRRFGTFIDARSVDHAGLSADLLFHDGLLEKLAGDGPAPRERALLETSIRHHSAYRLPQGLDEQQEMYCNILRDADKIDIFRVFCVTPVEEIYNVPAEVLKNAGVTDAVKECFFKRTAVLRSLKRTPADNIVGQICLVFELVYPESRRIAREQGYVERLLEFGSENPDTAQWFALMRENIWM